MTQNDQTGFLKKNCYPKNSILIMASFSLILGCGLQKSQLTIVPESQVNHEKSMEDEVKEQSSTNQDKKTDMEVTKDQIVSFVRSKGLFPKDADTKATKFADLNSFSGSESQCSFYELASSYVCVDREFVYIDSAVGGVERWGHVRVPSPHIRNILPSGDKTVSVCGKGFAVSLLAYAGCSAAFSTVSACQSVVLCGPAIGFAAGMCGLSVDVIREAASQCIRAE